MVFANKKGARKNVEIIYTEESGMVLVLGQIGPDA